MTDLFKVKKNVAAITIFVTMPFDNDLKFTLVFGFFRNIFQLKFQINNSFFQARTWKKNLEI